jgi:hypothetical protein
VTTAAPAVTTSSALPAAERVRATWQRFWFTPVPLRRLGLFRLAFTAFAFVDATITSSYMSRYGSVAHTFYHPIQLLKKTHLGPASQSATTAVLVIMSIALGFALVGLGTRVALFVAAPLYTWWFANFYSYGAVQHGRITVVIALWLLAMTPSGRTYSLEAYLRRRRATPPGQPLASREDRRDAMAGWALRVMMVLVVCAYTFGCFSKLRRQGFGWATGHALQRLIVEKHTALGAQLAPHPGLLEVLQILTLILEGSAVVVFLRGRVRDVYFLNSSLFHIGTLFLLNINFMGLMLGYLAFYDLEAGADRTRAFAQRRVPWLFSRGVGYKPVLAGAGSP